MDAPSHDRAITFKWQLAKFLTTSHAIRAISAAEAVLVANCACCKLRIGKFNDVYQCCRFIATLHFFHKMDGNW